MRHKIIEQLEIMKNSAKKVSELWMNADMETSDILSENYPFNDDFLETAYGIEAWVDDLVERLKEK